MFFQTKEEGKALLRTIAQKRSQEEEGEMQVCLFVTNTSQATVLLNVIAMFIVVLWCVDFYGFLLLRSESSFQKYSYFLYLLYHVL